MATLFKGKGKGLGETCTDCTITGKKPEGEGQKPPRPEAVTTAAPPAAVTTAKTRKRRQTAEKPDGRYVFFTIFGIFELRFQ